MVNAQRGFLLLFLIMLTGCGTAAVFETEEQRQARIDTAVHAALERERGWQTRFVERRTETMLEEQRVLTDRMAGLENIASAITSRLDSIERLGPADTNYVESTPATGPVLNAEVRSIQRDLAALTAAVAQLSGGDREGEAAVRARLERLELRTSRIAWPEPSSDVRAVHLASYRSHEAALAGWEVLAGRYPEVLGDETPTLVEVRTVAGPYIRLFAGAGRSGRDLLKIREALRDGGDYAMILPLPGNAGS
ncbi:MAG: hypothetical protein P1U88_10570 [Thalassobaculaceae bacterium]|nr:hypothetical protein [Thalassobaculaceae bacterium]